MMQHHATIPAASIGREHAKPDDVDAPLGRDDPVAPDRLGAERRKKIPVCRLREVRGDALLLADLVRVEGRRQYASHGLDLLGLHGRHAQGGAIVALRHHAHGVQPHPVLGVVLPRAYRREEASTRA